jgi:quercetin dioxygenase-like cupin family protein
LIVPTNTSPRFDIIGGEITFLAPPETIGGDHAILGGFLPPGVIVPLHRHDDPESFYILEGEMELYLAEGDSAGWRSLKVGDLAVIRGGSKHAWRNNNAQECKAVFVTGPNLLAFLKDLGRPVSEKAAPEVPDASTVARIAEVAQKHNLWLASPEENEAIGLNMALQA